MADEEKKEKTSVLLTGIDELSPKLGALRVKVESFKKNLEQTGLGKLDISGLFKGGSVITPFVDGIKSAAAFQGKLTEVSETAKTVDLPETPKAAAQNMNVFSASMEKVSAAVDAALVPAVGALVVGLEPVLTQVGSLLADNPKLVEGLAAGAIAFSAMQTAVTGATQVFDVMSMVLKTNPIMLIAMGIAVAAGLIVANWTPISAFFTGLWEGVKNAGASAMATLRSVLDWRPLEALAALWEPVTGFFSGIWDKVKAVTAPVIDFFKSVFSWSPAGLILENWGPLTGLFSAIWELLKALSVPVMSFLKGLFDWTPLGMIINNWGAITGFFASIWASLQPAAQAIKDFFGTLFDYSPLGMIVNNWGAIVTFFEPIWATLQASAQQVKSFFQSLFEWSPLEQIAQYWQPISEVFSALWGVVQALAAPVLEFLHNMFEWTPLGQIIKNWGPITEWFGELWQKLQTVIAPIKELFDGGFAGLIAKVTGKVETLTQAQRQTNAEGKGELAPAFFGASSKPEGGSALQGGSLPQSSSALIQQSAANNRTQLEGGLTVRFENAPAGLRTDQPQTNQPGLALSSRIGYRSLSAGGSNELA
ncbi:phage tail protein [Pseudomonas sp. FW215-R2]|uniref:phage tail protein n=1 Tax=unclassified Pseudomonas TaxID=196821 RepID=UPI000C88A76B|nr:MULTISPECIES: phage tail protein [unclassified Pseudomonas]PMX01565.1 phage tail protein [Pseudomonas sp. FW215-R2]PMX08009.1 phage tail protein [Pseudomonas sp. FW215-L1]PMX20670.1 phage tail protein [Pseudomonas sp. FW215-E1]PNA29079.1 phage tail protein [Pseudomonas sp. FW215-R4]